MLPLPLPLRCHPTPRAEVNGPSPEAHGRHVAPSASPLAPWQAFGASGRPVAPCDGRTRLRASWEVGRARGRAAAGGLEPTVGGLALVQLGVTGPGPSSAGLE